MGEIKVFPLVPEQEKFETSKEKKLREICQKLVDAFYGLFEQRDLVNELKKKLKEVGIEEFLLSEEEAKLLIKLCELRAKGQHKLQGDLVQQRLFELEEEKKAIARLQKYLPVFER